MGVTGLWRLIDRSGKRVPVETLEGKVLAIDISIWIHQALQGYQDRRGQSVPNAHLLILYNRLCKLLYFRIKPVFVFDGGVPLLKKNTIAARKKQKVIYSGKGDKAKTDLLHNLMKHTLVKEVLAQNAAEEDSSLADNQKLVSSNDKRINDMFKLPDISISSTADDSDSEDYDSSLNKSPHKDAKWRGNIHNVDISCSEFLSLPPDKRHEILSDLKDTRKQNSWGRLYEMPEESSKFSDFQMNRLLKRRQVQVSLENAEREMGGKTLTLEELEQLLKDQGVKTRNDNAFRIASNSETRIIYISDLKSLKASQSSVASAGDDSSQPGTSTEADSKTGEALSTQETADGTGEVFSTSNDVLNDINAYDLDVDEDWDSDVAVVNRPIDSPSVTKFFGNASNPVLAYMQAQSGLSQEKILEFIKQTKGEDTKVLGDGDKTKKKSRKRIIKENKKLFVRRKKVRSDSESSLESIEEMIKIKEEINSPPRIDESDEEDPEIICVSSRLQLNETKIKAEKNPPPKIETKTEDKKPGEAEVDFMSTSDSDCDFVEVHDVPIPHIVEPKKMEIIVKPEKKLDNEEDIFADVFESSAFHSSSDLSMEQNKSLQSSAEAEKFEMVELSTIPEDDFVDLSFIKHRGLDDSVVELMNSSAEEKFLVPFKSEEPNSSIESENKNVLPKMDIKDNVGVDESTGSLVKIKINSSSTETESENSFEHVKDDLIKGNSAGAETMEVDQSEIDEKISDSGLPKNKSSAVNNEALKNEIIDKIVAEIKESGLGAENLTEQILSEIKKSVSIAVAENLTDKIAVKGKESDSVFVAENAADKILSKIKESNSVSVLENAADKIVTEIKESNSVFNAGNLTKEIATEIEELEAVSVAENATDKILTEMSNKISENIDEITDLIASPSKPEKSPLKPQSKRVAEIITRLEQDKAEILQKVGNEKRLLEVKSQLETENKELKENIGKLERQSLEVTEQMRIEAQELLRLFGVPYVVAPQEAEAQCAYLELLNLTDGTITEDSDIWLFGGRCVYKNFFNQDKHVMEYRITDIEHHFKLSRQQMIQLALLVGSDYTLGIPGIGTVSAMEILANFPAEGDDVLRGLTKFASWIKAGKMAIGTSKTALRNKLKNVVVEGGFPSQAVAQAYLFPIVDESAEPFSWSKPNLVLLQDYTREKFGWSRMKFDETMAPVVKKMLDQKSQKSIMNYFKVSTVPQSIESALSKRVKNAVKMMSQGGADDAEDPENAAENTKKKKGGKRRRGKSKFSKDENNPVASTSGDAETENQIHETSEDQTAALKEILKINPNLTLNVDEVIPQREKDKAEALKKKQKAIEVFKKSAKNLNKAKKKPGRKAKNMVRKEAKLSESSSDSN